MSLHGNYDHDIWAFKRGTNRYGIRNHIVVMVSTFCANLIATEIGNQFKNRKFGKYEQNRVIVMTHNVGCCSVGFDVALGNDILQSVSNNPNVGAILIVSLGCGSYCSEANHRGDSNLKGNLVKSIKTKYSKKEVVIQARGGYLTTLNQACHHIEKLIKELDPVPQEKIGFDRIFAGVMNGSSDMTSGLFSNPSVGHFCDYLLDEGGRIAFGQTTETLGAEHLLLKRANSENTSNRIKGLLDAATTMRLAVENEGVETEPTQGNIRSGISTLAEKSLGTIAKIGFQEKHKIVEVVPHGKRANTIPGLHFVDTPGQDVLSLTGLTAAGTHLILFTTGRGAPTGSPISPTIKITANRKTFENLQDIIDLYIPIETILTGQKSLKEVALENIVPYVCGVVSGEILTKAERNNQADFQVRQLWMIE